MSVMTKGMGTATYGGGAIMTKGFGGKRVIPPDYTPDIVGARLPGPPVLVRAHEPVSPPDEMVLQILLALIVARYYRWRKYGW